MKRILLVLAIFFVGLLFFSPIKPTELTQEAASSEPHVTSKEELSRVTRVIDGDTIEIEGGVRVRYIGVDTPELVMKNNNVECFAQEAMAQNASLISGKTVRLVRDVSEMDEHKRLLRYVYVGDVFINEALVRSGAARATPIGPDTAFASLLYAAQQEAQKNNFGLWAGCR